ncbi:MAG: hypothetical protein HQK50_09360 [Oligoflexia bacterium]|nr:hypothetical protein [Oligoflexia bacterium]MBF0365768.1 hypothetical protein [Oligoflexia bacterium]
MDPTSMSIFMSLLSKMGGGLAKGVGEIGTTALDKTEADRMNRAKTLVDIAKTAGTRFSGLQPEAYQPPLPINYFLRLNMKQGPEGGDSLFNRLLNDLTGERGSTSANWSDKFLSDFLEENKDKLKSNITWR